MWPARNFEVKAIQVIELSRGGTLGSVPSQEATLRVSGFSEVVH